MRVGVQQCASSDGTPSLAGYRRSKRLLQVSVELRRLTRQTRMTRETVHIVQAYVAGRGNRLKADTPVPCKSADAAQRTAERLAATKLGVVAFSSSGDQELGEYDDEPVIIFKSGRLPPQFDD